MELEAASLIELSGLQSLTRAKFKHFQNGATGMLDSFQLNKSCLQVSLFPDCVVRHWCMVYVCMQLINTVWKCFIGGKGGEGSDFTVLDIGCELSILIVVGSIAAP